MTEPLPQLMDCAMIQRELGCKRSFAEAIMRQIPKITVPESRRVYVKREDVIRYLAERAAA